VEDMTGMFLGTNSLSGITFGAKFVTVGETTGTQFFPAPQGVWRNLDAEDNFRTPAFTSEGLLEYLSTPRENVETWVWSGANSGLIGDAFWHMNTDTGIVLVGEGDIFTVTGDFFTHWMNNTSQRNQVTRIIFLGPVTARENISGLFSNFPNLTEIVGINNINTENVENMSSLFANSQNILALDLSSWNTENVTNMTNMFSNTTSLRRITFGEKFTAVGFNSLPAVPTGWDNVWRSTDSDTVYSSVNLWNALSETRTSAQTWMWNALLPSTGRMGTGTATWSLAARAEGENYNELVINAGTTGTTNAIILPMLYNDTLQDHWMPLAGMRWRVHTIRITGPVVANENLRAFFGHFPNLHTIEGLEHLNTTHVTDMTRMFRGSNNLRELNLSGRNTANVKYMTEMFAGLNSLTELNLTGWNTAAVTCMDFIFAGTSALHTITNSAVGRYVEFRRKRT
jgi:surface protein